MQQGRSGRRPAAVGRQPRGLHAGRSDPRRRRQRRLRAAGRYRRRKENRRPAGRSLHRRRQLLQNVRRRLRCGFADRFVRRGKERNLRYLVRGQCRRNACRGAAGPDRPKLRFPHYGGRPRGAARNAAGRQERRRRGMASVRDVFDGIPAHRLQTRGGNERRHRDDAPSGRAYRPRQCRYGRHGQFREVRQPHEAEPSGRFERHDVLHPAGSLRREILRGNRPRGRFRQADRIQGFDLLL